MAVSTPWDAFCVSGCGAIPPSPLTPGLAGDNHLPFFIREDKFPELEVTKYNGRLVAVSYSRDDLLEQAGSLLFPQPLAAPHVGVHVPKVLFKEHIGLGVPEDDFDDPSDVSVRRQLNVRPDLVLVVFEGEHL